MRSSISRSFVFPKIGQLRMGRMWSQMESIPSTRRLAGRPTNHKRARMARNDRWLLATEMDAGAELEAMNRWTDGGFRSVRWRRFRVVVDVELVRRRVAAEAFVSRFGRPLSVWFSAGFGAVDWIPRRRLARDLSLVCLFVCLFSNEFSLLTSFVRDRVKREITLFGSWIERDTLLKGNEIRRIGRN